MNNDILNLWARDFEEMKDAALVKGMCADQFRIAIACKAGIKAARYNRTFQDHDIAEAAADCAGRQFFQARIFSLN